MKIAYCLPEESWIKEVLGGSTKDAAQIQQKYIAEKLRGRGYLLTYLAPRGLEQVVFIRDGSALTTAPRTWTAGWWFDLLGKLVWQFQQIFGIPYLNVFSNHRRYDACLQILPGHDIVFERNALYNVGVARACHKLDLPYVMFFDADQIAELEFMGKPLTGWLLWRARSLLRENLGIARRVICVSEPARDHMITKWDVPADKIVVIPNAVDVQRFKPDPDLRAETRTAFQLKKQPLLVFVGSFYQWHDVGTLLNAFALVLESDPDARLVLVGDGGERERMIRLALELSIEQSVQFTGFVAHEDIVRYVNAADIAVVPVPVMNQVMWLSPMKLFEYMASGKAVIASAMGQIVNIIQDGENGLLVPAGDVNALASAIIKLIADPDLRMRLGRQARKDTIENHSWEGYTSKLEGLFFDILNLSTTSHS